MQTLAEEGWPAGRWELSDPRLDPQRVRARLESRLEKLREGVAHGTRVLAGGARPDALLVDLKRAADQSQPADEIRVAHRSTPLRCFPTDQGVYESAWDLAFDLMQCAQLRFGEFVRVLAKGQAFWYVWSTYADGWVDPQALTPPLSPDEARGYTSPPRFVVSQIDKLPIRSQKVGGQLLGLASLGLRLPLSADREGEIPGPADSGRHVPQDPPLWAGGDELHEVQIPTPTGLAAGWIRRYGASGGYPPLSRDLLLERAFRLLNTPYGWGGTGDNRDCSRLMMDLFAGFGVLLPRNTWHQSQAGTRQVEVGHLSEAAKADTIAAMGRRAIVLLYLRGHIMLYLGRDGGHLYAFHLFSGYLVPCPGGGETMKRVNRAVVTALDLGLGSSRRSFLQRITRLVVFEGEGSAL
jgi:hypothetical protein